MTNLLRLVRFAFRLAFGLLFLLAGCAAPVRQPPSAPATSQAAGPSALNQAAAAAHDAALDHLPLYFVANHGQTDPRVAFYVPGKDNTIYFSPDGLTLAFNSAASPSAVGPKWGAQTADGALLQPGDENPAPPAGQRWAVKLDFVGADPDVQPLGEDQTAAVFSYFKGQPSQWQAGMASYAQLRYPGLWPGIDLVYSGQGNQMKYEFVVQPGADPAQIALAYRGANAVRLTADGQLEVTTPVTSFSDAAPLAYQVVSGQRVPVEMRYALKPPVGAGQAATYGYGFRLGTYNHALPLVLDPTVLLYSGYIGGAGSDYGQGIAVDTDGNAYVAGATAGDQTTFPKVAGPDLTANGSGDAFVAKVNAAGTALIYAGYIGGSSNDGAYGIAVNGAGEAYVTGYTNSTATTFPVKVGPSLTNSGGQDAFVAKVNAAGTGLVYAGYIGGATQDYANGIAIDKDGNAYVTGYTTSDETTFPVKVGPKLTYNGGGDVFVAKVNAAGSGLVYAGYIGGSDVEKGYGVAVDGAGHAYVTGYTNSNQATFPVTVGPDLTYNGTGNAADAFVAKVNAAGTALDYAGYIGGFENNYGTAIAVDKDGNAYVTGGTGSAGNSFPVTVGPDLTYNGGVDAFVAKVNAGGTALVYAGYIGGLGDEAGNGIALDSAGNAYVVGTTNSTQTTFPVLGGPDLTANGGVDAFVAKVNAAGTGLAYAGYIGGSGDDYGQGVAVDGAGKAYVTGYAWSSQATFPVVGGPDLTANGLIDAFVAKVGAPFVPTAFLYLPFVTR